MKIKYFLLILLLPILGKTAQVYVSLPADNIVNVIDTSTNTVVDTISTNLPREIAFLPEGTKAYIGRIASAVDVLNADQGFVVNTISLPASASLGVGVLPNGLKAYATQSGSDSIAVIDTTTDTVIKTISVGALPDEIVVTPDGTKVYVVNQTGDSVSVIDTTTDTVIATIAVGDFPGSPAVTPDGSAVYVPNVVDDTVSVINTTTNTVTTTIAVATPNPNAIAITPDGSFAYVTHDAFGADAITIIDVATNTVSTTITGVGGATGDIKITPDGSRAYVGSGSSAPDNIIVIDLATNTVLTTISMPTDPTEVTISPPRSQVNGEGTTNIGLGQTELVNIVTWTTPTDITTSKYLIYRDAALTNLAAEINDPSILKFEDHNVSEDQEFTYKVVAVDQFNNRYLVGAALLNFK